MWARRIIQHFDDLSDAAVAAAGICASLLSVAVLALALFV